LIFDSCRKLIRERRSERVERGRGGTIGWWRGPDEIGRMQSGLELVKSSEDGVWVGFYTEQTAKKNAAVSVVVR
jgi:hypothetical protein